MHNSTAPTPRVKSRKPKYTKPHKNFPLTPHPTGRWCKKVRGKLHYFGKIVEGDGGTSSQAALELWLEQKDDLLAGRVPRPKGESGPTLRELCNQFLTTKQRLSDSGELSRLTFQAYHDIAENLISHLGKDRLLTDIRPEDFEAIRSKWAERWGPVRLGCEIVRAKTIFHYAYKNGIIDRPIRFGEGFQKPSRKTLRIHRAAQGSKMFENHEILSMLESASQPLRTMILLGVNCAFGNGDIGLLPLTALDLEGGWINFPRGKTGINRRCPLWTETVSSIREWLARRPEPKSEADTGLVFLTVRGAGWNAGSATSSTLVHEVRKLTDRLKIMGRSFYSLRHSFETIGGDSRDQIATSAIMGHCDNTMSATYRERISDARLQAVAEHVRKWLFSAPTPEATEGGAK